jgi:hypothetical protein
MDSMLPTKLENALFSGVFCSENFHEKSMNFFYQTFRVAKCPFLAFVEAWTFSLGLSELQNAHFWPTKKHELFSLDFLSRKLTNSHFTRTP